MAAPKPFESQLLAPVEELIAKIIKPKKQFGFELRLQLLEAAASRIGTFSLRDYHAAFGISSLATYQWLDEGGKQVVAAINDLPIHPAYALSALSREPLDSSRQRTVGAYYTDFRLAQYIADLGRESLHEDAKVLDPACGAGVLLVAASIAVCGADRKKSADWLANGVYASDMSANALRGARLSLGSLTDDLGAICRMWENWRIQDSLMASPATWNDLAPGGFDLIVGNPPWEKIKLTRHEHLKAHGDTRHYGADYCLMDGQKYHYERKGVSNYAQSLLERFSLVRTGEPDLYMPFIELSSRLVRPGGRMAILVPAGLIRSQGTEGLRQFLFENGKDLSFTILENRARFFAIDTRFKFLAVGYSRPKKRTSSRDSIQLYHAEGTPKDVLQTGSARIGPKILAEIRPDLTIPEVRSDREWEMFVLMVRNGIDWSDESSLWCPEIVREVDMTKERPNFLRKRKSKAMPVVEGRMVQGHRFGVKRYISGTGRRAIWEPVPIGFSEISPQFWIEPKHLSQKVLARTKHLRAGFCDITGQTNERSMMASIVQPGTVCGNKVPTILFPKDRSEQRLFLWVGIVNSLPFDWMLRRIVTTTVNYFLLLGLPLPSLEPDSLPGRRVVDASRMLHEMDMSCGKVDPWKIAELKSEIDLAVLSSYGLGYEDLELMLKDFPLLDRGQRPIPGEKFSTITCDFLLLRAAKRFHSPIGDLVKRVESARLAGSVPYVPSEMAAITENWREAQEDG